MKVLLFLALTLAIAHSYTTWDAWHNVPTTWVSNQASSVASFSGYTRNGPSSQHPSGYFDDYSLIYTQYMYWKDSDEDQLIFCAPKYYLYN
jgi:hypothetical protein